MIPRRHLAMGLGLGLMVPLALTLALVVTIAMALMLALAGMTATLMLAWIAIQTGPRSSALQWACGQYHRQLLRMRSACRCRCDFP